MLVVGSRSRRTPVNELSADQLRDLAERLREGGEVQAACLCQEHAVAICPDDAQPLRELGELAHIVGKRKVARQAYERYLDLVPDDAEVRHLRRCAMSNRLHVFPIRVFSSFMSDLPRFTNRTCVMNSAMKAHCTSAK